MKNFIKLFIACAFLVSCGDFEEVIYDGVNGQTLAFFDASSSSLEVEIDQTNTLTVRVGVSTLSSSDRTVSVSADAASTATAAMYSFSPTVTIPANEYFGELTVTGIDEGLTTDAKTLILNLDDASGIIASSGSHTVSLVEICPIPATFAVGMYLIEQTSAEIDGPTLSTGTVVNVTGNGVQRSFMTSNYPNYCSTPNEFSFSLICNEIVVSVQDSNCPCSSGTGWFGPALGSNTTYDINDDSEFTITFADDVQADCGATADTTYKFTKQ